MARQREDSTSGFGSDSFLDIIANIVGILIILIVIAGVKVSRAPIESQRAQSVSAPPPLTIDSVDQPVADSAPTPEPATTPRPLPRLSDEDATPLDQPIHYLPESLPAQSLNLRIPVPPPVAPLDPIIIEPVNTVREQIGRIQDEIEQLERQLDQIDAQVGTESSRVQALRERRDALASEQAVLREAVRTDTSDLTELQKALSTTRGRYARLQKLIETVEEEEAPSEAIKHRLTPVGRIVHDQELHFRLAFNRISYVPVEELLERLKNQVQRQKNWLTRFHRHQGVVGPVEGYTMTYVVERQSLSAIDQLRHGTGTIRISVSEWVLETESGLVSESLDEALHPSSRFINRLQDTGPETVLTFWVYPDSYELYRQLQRFAHQEGFTVAGRPLPTGVKIAGGPNGSRSVAQ